MRRDTSLSQINYGETCKPHPTNTCPAVAAAIQTLSHLRDPVAVADFEGSAEAEISTPRLRAADDAACLLRE